MKKYFIFYHHTILSRTKRNDLWRAAKLALMNWNNVSEKGACLRSTRTRTLAIYFSSKLVRSTSDFSYFSHTWFYFNKNTNKILQMTTSESIISLKMCILLIWKSFFFHAMFSVVLNNKCQYCHGQINCMNKAAHFSPFTMQYMENITCNK